ncbi:MAG: hypothetical protein ACR2G6_07595 [Gemmatimonadaceae bacterium]
MSGRVAWRWGEVDAVDEEGGEALRLVHALEPAELWVRRGRLFRGQGYATATRRARQELARTGAIVRLRERGRYFMHAAGAVDPLGRAWLLAGDSGSGKSTLGYALSRAGWTILGDDGVVLELAESRVMVHPWRAPLQVSSALSDDFPELKTSPRTLADPTPLEPAPLDPRRRFGVVPSAAACAPAVAVVFLQRGFCCEMTRLDGADALAAMIRQSPWVILRDAASAAHLESLRRAGTLVPVFRLTHTPAQLRSIADVLAKAVA